MKKCKIDFYGIVCIAKVEEDSFELIGRNKITQNLLDLYCMIVLGSINICNFIKFILGFDPNICFGFKVIEEITKEREDDDRN
jgi:hypothetical protein